MLIFSPSRLYFLEASRRFFFSRHPPCKFGQVLCLIRILLDKLQLRMRSLWQTKFASTLKQKVSNTYNLIAQRIRKLRLTPRKLNLPLKHHHSLFNFTLLQTQLRKCSNSSFTFWIDLQRFIAASLSSANVLVPLVLCETFVHVGENIGWLWCSEFFKLGGFVKLFNGFFKATLIKEEFATKGQNSWAREKFQVTR